MSKGFTLIELLAVIVILAIIALIATPIVLGIISDTKESAMLRSAEFYLDGVENAVMKENLNQNGNFKPTECTITNEGNLDCDKENVFLEIEVDGEKPRNGIIIFEAGKIKEVTLTYQSGTIVKDENGNLIFSNEESDSKEEFDISTVSATLEDNSWETIQKVVKAGKAAEAGWSVGDTKTLEINGQTKEATIIGLNHDGENTVTFMIMSDINGDDGYVMNNNNSNVGGWKDSDMRAWLNGDIYNSMSNKEHIKEVTKMTDNVGGSGETPVASATSDRVFLLSVMEAGLQGFIENPDWYGDYPYMDVINSEGTTYDWFKTNSIGDWFWLRSPDSRYDDFFGYAGGYLSDLEMPAFFEYPVYAAFVIG